MNRSRSALLVLVLALLGVAAFAASPAGAAFPGKNGPIVYPFIHLNEGDDTGGLRIHGPTLKPPSKALTGNPEDSNPAFSPSGRLIAFEGNRENPESSASHIYVVKSDGSGLRRLTSGKFKDEDPAFSADGKTVFFSRVINGPPRTVRIFSVPLAGGEPTQISTGKEDREPVFTPDGKRVLFVGKGKGGSGRDIFSMSPLGNEVRLVLGGKGNQGEPDVSPNGKIIAFNSGSNIFTARINGSHVKAVTHSRRDCFSGACYHFPAFSPDGTHLVYRSQGRISSDISVSRLDGSNSKEFQSASNGEEGFGTIVGAPTWGRM
jgi:Tol biopolymer transport system component